MDVFQGDAMSRWLRRSIGEEASERKLDDQIEDSFPASDPPSFSPSPVKRTAFSEWINIWVKWRKGSHDVAN